MRSLLLVLLLAAPCNAAGPPFSGITPKPPIHPYTYFGPQSNPLDLQQMNYLREKYEFQQQQQQQQQNKRAYIPYIPQNPHGIRPTGHKTYFMNLP